LRIKGFEYSERLLPVAAERSAHQNTHFSLEVAMLRSTRWISLIAAISALSPLIAGADATGMFAPERVGHWYIGGGVGAYNEDSNSQLQNQDGQFGAFLSGGYRLSPNVALEIDGLFSSQKIGRLPTIPTTSGDTYLDSAGIGGVVKFILPLNQIELYAGAGLGVYNTQLHAEGSSYDASQDDTNVGYQALLGAEYFISRKLSVGLEYRIFKLEADFGSTIPGTIDVGGDFLFATVRGHF
jgi:opacity protein-like surface antigen